MTNAPFQRVLVTGSHGFVGSHLVPRLARSGARVSGLEPAAHGLVPGLNDIQVADLREPAAVRAVVRGVQPDAIVHLAAISSAARSFEDPSATFMVNAIGTWNLLSAVRDESPAARVLVVSSSEVYGPQPEGSRIGEDVPFRPVSPYGLSKAVAESIAETAGGSWGLDVIRARSFAHTGPGQTETFVIPGWAAQIARIERGEAPPVLQVGNLEVTRDMIDVRDVVEAYLALLERGARGVAYNVCGGTGVRLADLAPRLAGMARVPVRIEVDPARFRPADVPWLVGDPTRIEAATGWRPTVPLEETLSSVLDHFRGRQS